MTRDFPKRFDPNDPRSIYRRILGSAEKFSQKGYSLFESIIRKGFIDFAKNHYDFFSQNEKIEWAEEDGHSQQFAQMRVLERVLLDVEIWQQIMTEREYWLEPPSGDIQDVLQSFRLPYSLNFVSRGNTRPPFHSDLPAIDLFELDTDRSLGYFRLYEPIDRNSWKKTLEQADNLAQHAVKMWPFWSSGASREALTYYASRPLIRNVPYADIALVAIPFTANVIKTDFAEIAHEVGHYVYWNGKASDRADAKFIHELPLHNALTKDRKYMEEWIKEIFSDVFGAIVAGPIIAWKFQDYMKLLSKSDLLKATDEYPIAVLRPIVYIITLEHYGLVSDDVVKALKDDWFKHLAKLNIKEDRNLLVTPLRELSSTDPEDFQWVTLAQFKADLQDAMTNGESIFAPLNAWKAQWEHQQEQSSTMRNSWWGLLEAWDSTQGESAHLSEEINGTNIRLAWDAYFAHLAKDELPYPYQRIQELDSSKVHSQKWTAWMSDHNFLKGTIEGQKIPRDTWLKILDAGDWNTDGPHCSSGGGSC